MKHGIKDYTIADLKAAINSPHFSKEKKAEFRLELNQRRLQERGYDLDELDQDNPFTQWMRDE